MRNSEIFQGLPEIETFHKVRHKATLPMKLESSFQEGQIECQQDQMEKMLLQIQDQDI